MNFPDYTLDAALGYSGEIPETSGRWVPLPPDCPYGCIPELVITEEHGVKTYTWVCNCDPVEIETGGTSPPSGQTIKCGCYVYDNKKKPGGKMILKDTQIPQTPGNEEGIKRIKVKTTKHYWGFIWKNIDTDDEGCWKIDKVYNVKRMKTKAVFKDRVSDRMVIRSFRGFRLWNAFLKPVKHKWKIKRTDKSWHSLCLQLEDSQDNTSQNEESFMVATVNNAAHEFYDDHSSFQGSGKIKILIHTLSDKLNAAPMFSEMDQVTYSLSDITAFIGSHFGPIPLPGVFSTWWEVSKPDVFLYFGDNKESDKKKKTVYHEMTHVAQYTKLGPNWWEDYDDYIIDVFFSSQPKPYGDGLHYGFGMAEITEGMAESVEYYMADLQYETMHSNGDPNFDRYMNDAEELTYWSDDVDGVTEFIPYGLFFDLFDENGVNPPPAIVTAIEPPFVVDNVGNFSFEDQINSLLLEANSIEGFKSNLWMQSGAGSGYSQTNFDQLFLSYGY